MTSKARVALGSVALLFVGAVEKSSAADFSGRWTLNRSLSDDAAAKVVEVAGPETLAGAKTIGGFSFLPRPSYGRDVDRVNLRQFLLDAVTGLNTLEIEQSADEIKVIFGADALRNFYFGRPSAGADATGVTVTRRAQKDGEQVVLRSESDSSKLAEVLSRVAARDQVVYALRLEAELLKKPLDLKLVYDRAQPSAP